jgi:hypothetical protein
VHRYWSWERWMKEVQLALDWLSMMACWMWCSVRFCDPLMTSVDLRCRIGHRRRNLSACCAGVVLPLLWSSPQVAARRGQVLAVPPLRRLDRHSRTHWLGILGERDNYNLCATTRSRCSRFPRRAEQRCCCQFEAKGRAASHGSAGFSLRALIGQF